MLIRQAMNSDLTAVARVRAGAVVASPYYEESLDEALETKHYHPRIAGYFAGTYNPSFALPERTLLVAVDGQQIIGFVAGQLSTRMGCQAEVQWMFVTPERQRQGVGSALMGPLAQWFARHDAVRVIIDAEPANPFRGFYLKHGAIPLDAYWLYWPNIECALLA